MSNPDQEFHSMSVFLRVMTIMRFRATIAIGLLLAGGSVLASDWTPPFVPQKLIVANATNMHFRVLGMPGSFGDAHCPNSRDWAFVGEGDSGAAAKIATLRSAYEQGRQVRLFVLPVDFSSNGKIYCRIVEVSVGLFVTGPVHSAQEQVVSRVRVTSTGVVQFGVATAVPSTCDYFGFKFAFDGTSPAGQAMLSAVLTAKAAKMPLDIWYRASGAPGADHSNGCSPENLAVVDSVGPR
jgi:hypothetical protein